MSTSAPEFTMRVSALRLESPLLKHNASYRIKAYRREYSALSEYHEARYGAVCFNHSIIIATTRAASSSSSSLGHHQQQPQIQQQQQHPTRQNFQRRQTVRDDTVPFQGSPFWLSPACLIHFKHTDTSPFSDDSSQNIHDDDSARRFLLSNFTTKTPDASLFQKKMLQFDVIENLVGHGKHDGALSQLNERGEEEGGGGSPNNNTSSGSSSTLRSCSSNDFVIGTCEVDLESVFRQALCCVVDRHHQQRRVLGAHHQKYSLVAPVVRIPFRIGQYPNDVGAELHVCVRFDFGDDRQLSVRVVVDPSPRVASSSVAAALSILSSSSQNSQQQPGEATPPAQNNNNNTPNNNNNNSDNVIVSSPTELLRDLTALLAKEREAEPALIQKIVELTERKKALVTNQLLENMYGGASTINSAAASVTAVPPSSDASSATASRTQAAVITEAADDDSGDDDVEDELVAERNQNIRVSALSICEEVVSRYRRGLEDAMVGLVERQRV